MAANAPAPCITKSSTGMVLTVLDKQVIVFHNIGFQLSAPSWCGEMIWNANKFIFIYKKIKYSTLYIAVHRGHTQSKCCYYLAFSRDIIHSQQFSCFYSSQPPIKMLLAQFVYFNCNGSTSWSERTCNCHMSKCIGLDGLMKACVGNNL